MATTYNFSDRFSYPSANGVSSAVDANTAQTLEDQDLLGLSPELAEMVNMVKRYSVLLQRTTVLEIFNIITTESDPRIALILSAAKSKEDNTPIFVGNGAIKELMYADPSRPGQTKFNNRDLFSDGIRRVSCALTASRLIGQLAQIKEQADHATAIERQAINDLDRIVQTWDINKPSGADNEKTLEQPSAFYFQPGLWNLPPDKELHVEWQSPSLTSNWSSVGVYTGDVETWEIVNALADDINSKTVNSPDGPLVAVPQLSGPYLTNVTFTQQIQYHALLFHPRRPIPGIIAYPLNVRIELRLKAGEVDTTAETFPINRSPFIWGCEDNTLNTYSVNGALIVLKYNKLSTLRNLAENYVPFVLYIRNGVKYVEPEVGQPPAIEPAATSFLKYRVEPIQPNMGIIKDEDGEDAETIDLTIPRLVDSDAAVQTELDNNRFSQVALELLNSLASLNIDALVTGALIRNDPITSPDACAAIELVAWSKQKLITSVVLDVLEVPSDIELATGDRGRPLTPYSSKPRSIVVRNPTSDNSSGLVDGILRREQTYTLKRKAKSSLWTSINDEANAVQQTNWRN